LVADVFSYISGDDPWERVLPLEMEARVDGNEHRLVLSGELDLASADQLETAIREVCSIRAISLVLDLREVTFIDSSGLRAVIVAGQLCEQHGHGFALIPGPPEVQRLFELTGVAENLPFRTEPQAS
jgi:anti-anti-sigma factor